MCLLPLPVEFVKRIQYDVRKEDVRRGSRNTSEKTQNRIRSERERQVATPASKRKRRSRRSLKSYILSSLPQLTLDLQ